MFKWMTQEADRLHMKSHDRIGALVLDELSIQEDLSVVYKGYNTAFTGQVCTTPHGAALVAERTGRYVDNSKNFEGGLYHHCLA